MDLKPLITLVAIINPLAIVPFFIHYTGDSAPSSASEPFARRRWPRSA